MTQHFPLKEKNIVIAGPLSSPIHTAATVLTQMGANVALITKDTAAAKHITTQLMNMREANDNYGRAAAIDGLIKTQNEAQECIRRVAEIFGSFDVFVDAHLSFMSTAISSPQASSQFDGLIETNLKPSFYLIHACLPFIKTRKRGRIIFLLHELARKGSPSDAIEAYLRSGILSFSQSLCAELIDSSVTVNSLSIGLSEEYLREHYPQATSIKDALEQMKKIIPGCKITEPDRVANAIAFLASSQSAGINGQNISVYDGVL